MSPRFPRWWRTRSGKSWLVVNLTKDGKIYVNLYIKATPQETISIPLPRGDLYGVLYQIQRIRRGYPNSSRLGKWHVKPEELRKILGKK